MSAKTAGTILGTILVTALAACGNEAVEFGNNIPNKQLTGVLNGRSFAGKIAVGFNFQPGDRISYADITVYDRDISCDQGANPFLRFPKIQLSFRHEYGDWKSGSTFLMGTATFVEPDPFRPDVIFARTKVEPVQIEIIDAGSESKPGLIFLRAMGSRLDSVEGRVPVTLCGPLPPPPVVAQPI